jgi:hypothetical protein
MSPAVCSATHALMGVGSSLRCIAAASSWFASVATYDGSSVPRVHCEEEKPEKRGAVSGVQSPLLAAAGHRGGAGHRSAQRRRRPATTAAVLQMQSLGVVSLRVWKAPHLRAGHEQRHPGVGGEHGAQHGVQMRRVRGRAYVQRRVQLRNGKPSRGVANRWEMMMISSGITHYQSINRPGGRQLCCRF